MDIKLRKVQESDLEKIMEWRMKPSVTKYMYTDPVLTLEGQKKWFASISVDESCRYWVIDVDGVGIGVLGLIRIEPEHQRCSWVWYIGEDGYRGKGIAKKIQLNLYDYVFYTMGFNRLYSDILAFNVHEIKNVHEAVGYKVEGVLEQHVIKNGEFLDVVMMGITKDRWEKIKGDFDYPEIPFE
jgi:UDP-4-amino-4,6-dideoxy-N-acetyl-beta-L-altrosamine N-acetyltransferase